MRKDGVYFEPDPWGAGAVAFLFPGQGSQRAGMLGAFRDVLPGYSRALGDLDAAWRTIAGDSLSDRVHIARTRENDASLTPTTVAQPALGLVSMAAATALGELGVRPAYAAGHSYGELPALAIAGAFDGPTLLRLSLERGRALAGAGERAPGAMLALVATEEEARALVEGTSLVLANLNAPRQVVIAGDVEAIAEAERRAAGRALRTVRLKTSCAFHSPAMALATPAWRAALEAADIGPPERSLVLSNVTARPHDLDAAAVRELLARQTTEPVRWRDEIEHLYALGARIFVEVGPGEVLTTLTGAILGERPHLALPIDPGPRDARTHLVDLLARLASHGVPVDVAPFELQLAPRDPAPREETARPRYARRGLHLTSGPVSAFFDANRRAMELFFAQQERVVALGLDLPAEARTTLFERLVASNERALREFLTTQEHALSGGAPLARTEVASPPAPRAEPAAGVDRAAPTADPSELESSVLRTLVDLTGFPVDFIRRESEFERDLGVDSVTMVEVYFKLLEIFPALEEHAPRLRTCKSVGDLVAVVIDATRTRSAEGAPPSAPPTEPTVAVVPAPAAVASPSGEWSSVPAIDEIRAELSSAIAAAAGCVLSSLDGRADLETDLGLDAFTREGLVEALVAIRPALALARRELLHARTLEGCVAVCAQILGCSREDTDAVGPARAACAERFVRIEEPIAPPSGTPPRTVLVVGEPGPVWGAACVSLRAAGHDVQAVGLARREWQVEGERPVALDDVPGLVRLLTPLARPGMAVLFLAFSARDALSEVDAALWSEQVEHASVGLFVLAKALVGTGSAVASLGVALSHGGPAWAGARGLARALGREWPHVRVRSLSVEPAFDAEAAPVVLQLLACGPTEHDLVLRAGQLHRLRLVPRVSPVERAPIVLEPGALVLVLGGADGITAEVTHSLAQKYRCRFVAVGRTPMPAAMPYAAIQDERSLKRALWDELRSEPQAGDMPDGERLQKRLRLVLRQRAIWRTRERVEAAGGTFLYHPADVSRPGELAEALASIRAEHGPFHGVVHGAGVIDDGLIEDKSVESFRRVLHTKARSVFALYALLRDEPLRFAFLFSSLSAHAGTAGQTDYIAGNEILQAVARSWNERVPYPARAILWSVWSEAGLAGAGLKRQMERFGLHGIGNDEGVQLFGEELTRADAGDAWVLLAPPSTLAFALRAGARQLGEGAAHA